MLAWDPSPGPNEILGYKIYYGAGSGLYTNSISVGNVTNGTVPDLTAGLTYWFAATAVDIFGLESDFSNEASYSIPAGLGNQPPTLNSIANVTILEGAGTQTVNLAGITPGGTNETQTLTVTASSSDASLIPSPSVNYTSPNTSGTLTFAPAAYANGSATITVTVNDGAASNNIVSRAFTVTVRPVNQTPTLNTLADVTILEYASPQSITLRGISSGATNENQTLTVTASSSNTGVVPTPSVSYTSPNGTGTLTYGPLAYAFGSATITVTVNDGGASNNIVTRTFMVTVTPVNQAPTLSTVADVTILEGAGPQSVSLSGITPGATNENQTLTVSATSSDTRLIPTPSATYTSPSTTGSLSITPVPYAFGSATITVNVSDGGASNNLVSRTFTVTVTPVNQAPTLAALSDVIMIQNDPPKTVDLSGISSGMSNEVQTLVVTATSSDPSVIPNPTVTYTSPNATGSIAFKPVTNAHGSATITVRVNDGASSNNIVSRSFLVTVDQPPAISTIADVSIAIDTQTSAIPFTISDAETPLANLILSALSSNTTLVPSSNVVLAGTGGNRTVRVTPLAGKSGVADVTITVNDGLSSSSTSFRVTVYGKPGAPASLRIVSAQ